MVAKGQSKSSQPYLCYPQSNYIDYGSKIGMNQADHTLILFILKMTFSNLFPLQARLHTAPDVTLRHQPV